MNLHQTFVRLTLQEMEDRQKEILGTRIYFTDENGELEFRFCAPKPQLEVYMEELQEILPAINNRLVTIAQNKENAEIYRGYYGEVDCSVLKPIPVPEGCNLTCHDKMKIAHIYSKIAKKLYENKEILFDKASQKEVAEALKNFHYSATTKELCADADLGEYFFTQGRYAVAKDYINLLQDQLNTHMPISTGDIASHIAGFVIHNDLVEGADF